MWAKAKWKEEGECPATKLKVVSCWENSKHTGEEGGVVHAERESQRLPLPRVEMAQKEGNVIGKAVSGAKNSKK